MSSLDFEVASTLFAAGRKSEAAAELRDFMAGHPDEGGLLASMQAVIYASTNQPRQAAEQIRLATLTHGAGFIHYHHTAYNIASAYSLLHNSSAAMKWLQMATNDEFPCYPLIAHDKAPDSLKNNPAFNRFHAEVEETVGAPSEGFLSPLNYGSDPQAARYCLSSSSASGSGGGSVGKPRFVTNPSGK